MEAIPHLQRAIRARTPLEVIGIRVKNNKKISKQSTRAGKLDFFWAKWMGYPPIRITGTALSNEESIPKFSQNKAADVENLIKLTNHKE